MLRHDSADHETPIRLGVAPADFRRGIDGFVALCKNKLAQVQLSHNDLTVHKLKKLLGVVRSSEKLRVRYSPNSLFPRNWDFISTRCGTGLKEHANELHITRMRGFFEKGINCV